MSANNRKPISLTQYLVEHQRRNGSIPADLRLLIEVVARACKRISIAVKSIGLPGITAQAAEISGPRR